MLKLENVSVDLAGTHVLRGVTATLEAYEGETKVFARAFEETIRRKGN